MRYQGVFFDFDYTLGDATEAILAGFAHGMTALGHPVPERDAVRRTVGLILEDAYTALTGDEAEKRRARFRALFSEVARPMQARGVPLCEGAAELIRALSGAGISLAVVSTKHTATLVDILNRHGLAGAFSSILGGDLVSSPKPAPDGILTAMARQGLDAREVLYCGDTVIDAETAERAGVDFCAVLNGTTPGDAFAAYPHVHIAPDLVELKAWLGI